MVLYILCCMYYTDDGLKSKNLKKLWLYTENVLKMNYLLIWLFSICMPHIGIFGVQTSNSIYTNRICSSIAHIKYTLITVISMAI